ncbi:unnamed protein product [Heterobilharzia americana]|nr:unnamed protein product [Heterobilharzia americana]
MPSAFFGLVINNEGSRPTFIRLWFLDFLLVASKMKPDILLPRSFIRKNQLYPFQVVVVNDKFPAVIGLSTSDSIEIPESTVSRFGSNMSERFTIQLPTRVTPAKLLKMEITTPIDSVLLPLLEASVYYRLQMSHTMIGTMEIIRALGNYFSVQSLEVVSTSGELFSMQSTCNKSVKKESDFSPQRDYSSFSFESFSSPNNSWSCEFVQSLSDHHVFKIGASTQLILVQAKAPLTSSVGLQDFETSKLTTKNTYNNGKTCNLFGLDAVENIVLNYLYNFLLTCTQGNKTVFSSTVEPGIVLYGLPGCGKRTLLESIAHGLNGSSSITESLYEKLTFITLTSKLIKELSDESSHCLSAVESYRTQFWLNNLINQSDVINDKTCIAVVILWPNIDKWINTDENGILTLILLKLIQTAS